MKFDLLWYIKKGYLIFEIFIFVFIFFLLIFLITMDICDLFGQLYYSGMSDQWQKKRRKTKVLNKGQKERNVGVNTYYAYVCV